MADNRELDFLLSLEELLRRRQQELPEGSYTAKLFGEGKDRILKKVGEEAAEAIIASKNASRQEMVYESADLVFHLMLALREMDIPLTEVVAELAQRHG
jgi:phosphoribosyl-ATP pyrophosphohydrolase/phosphoribosyl-AMP cyclohydrolase